MALQWPLIIFTLFCCFSAGVFAMQGVLALMGKDHEMQLPALITSFVCLVIGGVASFLHLQHWDRIFNGFGHITSGITQELIAIVFFGIAIVLYFFMLRKHGKDLPKWCGIMAIVLAVALVCVMAHSYNMEAHPVWNTFLLEAFYLTNAAFLGALSFGVLGAFYKKTVACDLSAKAALVGGLAQALVTVAYVVLFIVSASSFADVGNYYDPTNSILKDPSAVLTGVLTGQYAALFWLGIVFIGLVVPLVLAYLAKKKISSSKEQEVSLSSEGQETALVENEGKTSLVTSAVVALLCATVGSLCFRCLIYILGFSIFVFY